MDSSRFCRDVMQIKSCPKFENNPGDHSEHKL